MTPEERARFRIDKQLVEAGWVLQNKNQFNRLAALGVAVREFALQNGEADYLLFVDGKAIGVLEAKPTGTTLLGVAEQTKKYLEGLPTALAKHSNPLPFGFEASGEETYFIDTRDPNARSRRIFQIFRPEILLEWIRQTSTLRERLTTLPPVDKTGLRACQIEAVGGLEQSLGQNKPRALIQMATGSGKTFTAVTSSYRLIKHGGAKRILFLVDRNNLGRQTLAEFQQYITPDDGRKFTELYNVQMLQGKRIDPVAKVVIGTIQRLFSMLKGEEIDDELDNKSLHELGIKDQKPKEVVFNPDIPLDSFDFIIADECHRSIYNLWRGVLEYFDGFLIGLTATPSKQTIGFFNQNLVTEYGFSQAVKDNVNVDYDVYRIRTQISETGSRIESGEYVDKRDRQTRRKRWEALDNDLEYTGKELDRSVVAVSQIRTVIRTYKDKLLELFPDRSHTPKTLIFAKTDSHAEDIVQIVREEFGKGNDFCKKITYRTTEDPEVLIKEFRNNYYPRIAVTVDMISTGTDIKPLEVLLFMRDVASAVYFEQMKGRATRTILPDELKAVTPDAKHKTHFVLVDAVGVTETIKTDSKPLEKKPSIPFAKILQQIAMGDTSTDTISSLASRLTRLDKKLSENNRDALEQHANQSLNSIITNLIRAADPDSIEAHAIMQSSNPNPTDQQYDQAQTDLAETAAQPFNNPEFRRLLEDIQRDTDQIIDTVSQDQVLYAGYDFDKAKRMVQTWQDFIEQHKNELTALQIIYNQPRQQQKLTFAAINQLAKAIEQPPYYLTPQNVWSAYENLEKTRVKQSSNPQRLLTDLVALVRFTTGQDTVLTPFMDTVQTKYQTWLSLQQSSGTPFNPEQIAWLDMIRDHIASSAAITVQDLELSPFHQRGGAHKAVQLFKNLKPLLEELSTTLSA
jgi:type I restriction enzyme, R subunit